MKSTGIVTTGCSASFLSLAISLTGWAQTPVPVENAGFESPELGIGGFETPVPGWNEVGAPLSIGVLHPAEGEFDAGTPEGDNVAFINGQDDGDGISQVLAGAGSTLTSGAQYTLAVEVGNSNSFDFEGYRVQLLAGGVVLAEDDNSLNPANGAFKTSTVVYAYDPDEHESLIGESLEIRLLSKAEASGEINFDDVRLTVEFTQPVANTGGPYTVVPGGMLQLDASASLASGSETITGYEWDLTGNGDFSDLSGATPSAISFDDLIDVWGMEEGQNTIQLRVTDSAANTSVTATTVTVITDVTPLVYEPFDYPGENVSINGLDGGVGFDGAWNGGGWFQGHHVGRTDFNNGTGTTINSIGGLEFPGLATSGSGLSRFGNGGQREANRILSETAQSDLTQDNTTIWFSVLMSADTAGVARVASLIFGNQTFVAESGNSDNGRLAEEGQGFGVGFRTDSNGGWSGGSGSPNALAFLDSRDATVDEATDFEPVTQDGATHQDTILVVGKINWNPVGMDDELFIFNITDVADPEPDESDAIASLTADFDQSTWNTIAIHDSGFSILDEIRMGTSYHAVVPQSTIRAAFADWAAGFPGLTDTDPALDFDGGGQPTALEWVLGGDPTDPSDDAAIAPMIDAASDPDGKLRFTFRRNIDAENDPDTTITVEYGSDLVGWTAAAHEGEGAEDITVSVVADGFGPGIEEVTVALPPGLADGGRLFVRLNVEVDAEEPPGL